MHGVKQEVSRANAELQNEVESILGADDARGWDGLPYRAYLCTVCEQIVMTKTRKVEAGDSECACCTAINSYRHVSARLVEQLTAHAGIDNPEPTSFNGKLADRLLCKAGAQ